MNHRILFMGTPPFAVASLNALMHAGMHVAGVVTAPDRPAGRGRQLRMSAVKERALQLGLPVLQPANLKDPAFHEQLDALDASLYIVVAFRMLPKVVWQRPALGTVNLHASLLPNYRGAAPINWAIIHGEERTGATTFLINEQIDTGDILLRETEHIQPTDTAGTLHDRLMATGAELLVRTAKNLFDGTAFPIPQEQYAGDDRNEAPKLTPANCRIDWHKDARHVHNLVRGLAPAPGAWTSWNMEGQAERQLKVLATRLVPPPAERHAPGTVIFMRDQLVVPCGSGAIEVLQLQMQDKRPMDTASFLRGLQQHAMVVLR